MFFDVSALFLWIARAPKGAPPELNQGTRVVAQVESFTFYFLTEAMGKQEWVLGYFSKVRSECHSRRRSELKTRAKSSSCRKRSRTTITTSLALWCFRRSVSGDGRLF